jgi:hypothetical protein
MTDIQVILNALQRERDDLHSQLMQVDRIIKRVKTGTYSDEPIIQPVPKQLEAIVPTKKPLIPISSGSQLKMQILKVFDVLGTAITLKQIMAELEAMTGHKPYIRDNIRALQKAQLLRIIKDKTATRGFLWVKASWIEDGQLLDKYKPEGFDILYKQANLIYE